MYISTTDNGKNDVKIIEVMVTLLVKLRLAERTTLNLVAQTHLSYLATKVEEHANVIDRTSVLVCKTILKCLIYVSVYVKIS